MLKVCEFTYIALPLLHIFISTGWMQIDPKHWTCKSIPNEKLNNIPYKICKLIPIAKHQTYILAFQKPAHSWQPSNRFYKPNINPITPLPNPPLTIFFSGKPPTRPQLHLLQEIHQYSSYMQSINLQKVPASLFLCYFLIQTINKRPICISWTKIPNKWIPLFFVPSWYELWRTIRCGRNFRTWIGEWGFWAVQIDE